MIIRCPFCTRSHSIAEITKEQIQSEADNPTGVLVSDFPNPSADEEIETPSDPVTDLFEILRESKVRFVFWVCPKGCDGRVVWNDKKTDATCMVCGMKRSEDTELLNAAIEHLESELQQLRASLAEKEMALNEQMVMRSQDVKTRDELIESMADTFKQWQDRYAKLQSELATAQNEYVKYKDAADTMQKVMEKESDSLRSQLQTAMEERDTLQRLSVAQNANLLTQDSELRAANSRLEEAHKDLGADYRKHLDAAMQLGETCSCTDINYLIDVLDAVLLSRLSASRETGRKDSGL